MQTQVQQQQTTKFRRAWELWAAKLTWISAFRIAAGRSARFLLPPACSAKTRASAAAETASSISSAIPASLSMPDSPGPAPACVRVRVRAGLQTCKQACVRGAKPVNSPSIPSRYIVPWYTQLNLRLTHITAVFVVTIYRRSSLWGHTHRHRPSTYPARMSRPAAVTSGLAALQRTHAVFWQENVLCTFNVTTRCSYSEHT